jgi:hypothetical protein
MRVVSGSRARPQALSSQDAAIRAREEVGVRTAEVHRSNGTPAAVQVGPARCPIRNRS